MYIASISTDVKIHAFATGDLLHTYKTNTQDPVKSISWAKDGYWLVVVPNKGSAELISIKESLKLLHSIQEIQQPTCAVFQNGTKRSVAIGSSIGTVAVYDIKSKQISKHFPRAPSTILKLEYCVSDSFLMAACGNGDLLQYNNTTCTLSKPYRLPNLKSYMITNMRCHASKRNVVATGTDSGIVAIWDIHAGKLKRHFQAHGSPVTDLTFSPEKGDVILTSGLDRKFAFFDISSNTCISQITVERSPTAIDICHDVTSLAVALQNGMVHTYDIRKMSKPLNFFQAHNSQINQLLFQKKYVGDGTEYTFPNDVRRETCHNADHSELSSSGLGLESFSPICGGNVEVLPKISETSLECSVKVDDSFLRAVGLNSSSMQNITGHSQKREQEISGGLPTYQYLKPSFVSDNSLVNANIPMACNSGQGDFIRNESSDNDDGIVNKSKLLFDAVNNQMSSTPKFVPLDVPMPFESPIISSNNKPQSTICNYPASINMDDFKDVMKNIVKEEIKSAMADLNKHMKYELADVMAHLGRSFVDLQVNMVKEFIETQHFLQEMKNILNELLSEDITIQENMQLKSEVTELKHELAQLKQKFLNNN